MLQRARLLFLLAIRCQLIIAASNISAPSSSSQSPFRDDLGISEPDGPILEAKKYCWERVRTPTIVGTVHITVDEALHTTFVTTVYNMNVPKNGTLEIFTPTSTDLAGTSTTITDGTTMIYPTEHTSLYPSLTWSVLVPTTVSRDPSTCCYLTETLSPRPSYATLSPGVGDIDPRDEKGWYYDLTDCNFNGDAKRFKTDAVSSIFANHSLTIPHPDCLYTRCHQTFWTMGAQAHISALVSILVTEQITLSSLSTTFSPATTNGNEVKLISSIPSPPTKSLAAEPVILPSIPASTAQSQGQQTPPAKTSSAPGVASNQPSPPVINSLGGGPDSTSQAIVNGGISGSPAAIPNLGHDTSAPPFTIAFSALPPLTIESSIILGSASLYIIGDQTLLPGSNVTLSGTTIRLAATPTEIIVGSNTAVLTTKDTGEYIWRGLGSTGVTSKFANSTASPAVYRGEARRSMPDYFLLVAAIVAIVI